MSATDPREDMTSSLASQRAALEGLPWDDELVQQAYRRVSVAWDELNQALYVCGITLDSYAESKLTLKVLAEAFAWRWHCRCRPDSPAAEAERLLRGET